MKNPRNEKAPPEAFLGETRGRKRDPDSVFTAKRVEAFWRFAPDAGYLETAFVIGMPMNVLRTWVSRGHVTRPPASTPEKNLLRDKEPIAEANGPTSEPPKPAPVRVVVTDDTWDDGEVPTIDSIRREIKRKMKDLISDPDSISKYATALGRLSGVKAEERDEGDADLPRANLYLPRETKKPPKDVDE